MGAFRFGVVMHAVGGREEWTNKCREAERLGYHVILVPDPFPALTAAAAATERPRVGPFVLNTSFWNPTLLARAAATVDQLTGGRLEVDLGAGHRKEEFEATGFPRRPLAERIEHLENTITALSREGQPAPVQDPVRRCCWAVTATVCSAWPPGMPTSWATGSPTSS
jgi:alkanesulfonate monooxygenase SsuD/methylene tetrahydromethanopterin reductase-like flavin-dependent oxidoreductase (luciferase family)